MHDTIVLCALLSLAQGTTITSPSGAWAGARALVPGITAVIIINPSTGRTSVVSLSPAHIASHLMHSALLLEDKPYERAYDKSERGPGDGSVGLARSRTNLRAGDERGNNRNMDLWTSTYRYVVAVRARWPVHLYSSYDVGCN